MDLYRRIRGAVAEHGIVIDDQIELKVKELVSAAEIVQTEAALAAGNSLKADLRKLAVRLMELAHEKDEVQHAVDELIYEHCGTSKKWSNVNNQGIVTQFEALGERLGAEEAIALANELLTTFGPIKAEQLVDLAHSRGLTAGDVARIFAIDLDRLNNGGLIEIFELLIAGDDDASWIKQRLQE